MINPYSEDSICALRNVLFCYNKFEVGNWLVTSGKINVTGDHTLRRFSKGDSKKIDLDTVAKVYKYFRIRALKRDLWDRPWALQCKTDLEKLYDLTTLRDPYRVLKERAKLTNEELKRSATELDGNYFIVRPDSESGCILAHLRIFDSFLHFGLATCRFSRAIREEVGKPIERDLLIEGGVFRKSATALNILGYDVDTGDIRMLALRDTGQGGHRGFMTGFDTSNVAFSTRVVIQKIPEPLEYSDVRDETGQWTEIGALVKYLEAIFGKEHLFIERCKAMGTQDYLTSQPGI